MSAASETEFSWGRGQFNEFTYWWNSGLAGHLVDDDSQKVDIDTDDDGKRSMVELYEYARAHDMADETPFYEDNGFMPAHSGPMPGQGEGSLGSKVFVIESMPLFIKPVIQYPSITPKPQP